MKKKKKKKDKHSPGGETWCNFVWSSPHRPSVLSGRGPLITFKFLWAHEKTRHKFDIKKKKMKEEIWQHKMGWNETLILCLLIFAGIICSDVCVVQFEFELVQMCREGGVKKKKTAKLWKLGKYTLWPAFSTGGFGTSKSVAGMFWVDR